MAPTSSGGEGLKELVRGEGSDDDSHLLGWWMNQG